jgi:hypothetical protein
MLPDKIQKWLINGVFPQRVLLSGSRDVFDSAVKIAAQLQNCTETQLLSGAHEDTLVFRDLGKSFKIDFSEAAKKDDQGVFENVRGMIRWVSQKPLGSHYRVIVLENFERASREAPHSLLKILEEPPPRVVFLFTTQNPYRILDTILSRMTVIRIPHKISDIVVDPEVRNFVEDFNVIARFGYIEDLDQAFKKEKNRRVFYDFLEQVLQFSRAHASYFFCLPFILETQKAIAQNQNPRFCLERLALKMRK